MWSGASGAGSTLLRMPQQEVNTHAPNPTARIVLSLAAPCLASPADQMPSDCMTGACEGLVVPPCRQNLQSTTTRQLSRFVRLSFDWLRCRLFLQGANPCPT